TRPPTVIERGGGRVIVDRIPIPEPPAVDPTSSEPWRIEGVVKEHDGRGIVGATVRMWFARADVLDALPPATTDAKGQFSATTQVPSTWGRVERGTAALHAVAEAPRHHPSVEAEVVLKEPADALTLELFLQVGAKVSGRVVDEAGKPLGASIVTM